MKNQKMLIAVVVCIIVCGIFFAIRLLSKNEDENLKNYPQEIQEVYNITKYVSVSGMQEGMEHDFQALDDKNKCIMLFNYLEYKGWLQEEISFDTMDTALNNLFGNTFDYVNLLFTYGKYVYQNDGTKIERSVLTSKATYEYTTKIDDYSIDENQVTLDMKISGNGEEAIYRYVFEKNSNDYRLVSISLNSSK